MTWAGCQARYDCSYWISPRNHTFLTERSVTSVFDGAVCRPPQTGKQESEATRSGVHALADALLARVLQLQVRTNQLQRVNIDQSRSSMTPRIACRCIASDELREGVPLALHIETPMGTLTRFLVHHRLLQCTTSLAGIPAPQHLEAFNSCLRPHQTWCKALESRVWFPLTQCHPSSALGPEL